MATVITQRKWRGDTLPDLIFDILPQSLCDELISVCAEGVTVDEIRLRVGRRASVTSCARNIMLDFVIDRRLMDDIVAQICEHSLYAHADTINCGYITLPGAIRVGIVGRASCFDGEIGGVYEISSLCFRLPRSIVNVGEPVCGLIRERAGGVLVFSPPGVGKTTLLRAVCRSLSSGKNAMRVIVIDTRGELSYSMSDSSLCLDVLYGYPKAIGIEIAARSMNAELIVCDEIGETGEAEAIISAQNCGVPLLASAHASDVGGLLRRTGIRRLHDARVFGAYVGISRVVGKRDYLYNVTRYKEADAYL